MLAVGLGGLLLTSAMMSDLRNDLLEINKIAKKESRKKAHTQATEKLCRFIQMHTKSKEFSKVDLLQSPRTVHSNYSIKTLSTKFFRSRLFSEALIVIEQMGMVFLAWSMIVVCIAMLLIQSDTVEYINEVDC